MTPGSIQQEQTVAIADITAGMERERMFTKIYGLVLDHALKLLKTERASGIALDWDDVRDSITHIEFGFDFAENSLSTTIRTTNRTFATHVRYFGPSEDRVFIVLAIASMIVAADVEGFTTNADDIYDMIHMEAIHFKEVCSVPE